jgi:hypothetical protein
VLIASNSSIVNFYDLDLRGKKKLFHIDITALDLQLKGYDLSGIIQRPVLDSCVSSHNINNN